MPAREENPGRLRISEEIIAGCVCFAVAGLFGMRTGDGGRWLDWVYPQWLLGVIAAVGVILVVRGLLGYGNKRSLVPPVLRGGGTDVAAFAVLAIGYVLLVDVAGFWPMSALLVALASLYFAGERSRRTLIISVLTAVAVSLVGAVVFREIFYIPFPEPPWWPF
ncbi:tripartite tricarboxylate transporter TctB family protein [Actinobacteria bacterium YIM 96077]|uniref:DUF1468 domain-containing protein n=1 Tax=Phytoactinopolyspora halophila TaxID=1981511 RepID=A0A329R2Y3_9ACTN|nr:tripartite tricarboxylate transporter TctB family protein [Phytoactinopolyspora halophila]AYY11705.1 tripartite tricarboxylate transporter TctB family protein [Actinobacteria bacterium YIM 96077]RAW17862.1 hypothetical protein DPM12_03140 [Phytoactinopolyspora halophila]